MKKLFTILSIALFSASFFACEEEHIEPTHNDNKMPGGAKEDPGQWDD